MQNEIFINGLYARVDWLEFTIDTIDSSSENVYIYLERLGLCSELFEILDRGGIGYRQSMRHIHENIFVYFDGSVDMGIHIRVSGASVTYVLEEFLEKHSCMTPWGTGYDVGEYDTANVLPLFMEDVLKIGHFTRIDLAVDDIGCNYYSVNDVANFKEAGMCVTKFRSWNHMKGGTFAGEYTGDTFYCGSRTSDVFLRVYNKGLEQKVPVKWVRWELEIKHSKADVVAQQIIERQNFGLIVVGILKAYVRFINLDNSRVSRCSLHPVWETFVGDVEKLCLTLQKREKTVADKENWVVKQCMPTIAGLIAAKHGDISFLRENLEEHFERLNAKDKALFLNARSGGADEVL